MIEEQTESTILSSNVAQRNQEINFLSEALGRPCRLKRIFRASEHNFRADAFHKHCDNI